MVDNRALLLGLDKMYRDAVKRYEGTELLNCARRVAAALRIGPARVPVEGYYDENEQLTEYFLLLRALHAVDESRTAEVAALREFRRLRDIASAPLFGRPEHLGKLLPVGRDPLAQALLDTRPQWTVERLTTRAHAVTHDTDDISLVGLGAWIKDSVVLAALRESVVLYAWSGVLLGIRSLPPKQFVWQVDDELAQRAGRFIDMFNALFGEKLPSATAAHAGFYWQAYEDNRIFGRCARLGVDDRTRPIRYYHWGICNGSDGKLTVQDFWDSEIWTTTRYRSAVDHLGRGPRL